MTSTLIYFIKGTHTLARTKITQKPNQLRKRVQKVAWLYKTMKLSIIVMGNSNRLSTLPSPCTASFQALSVNAIR